MRQCHQLLSCKLKDLGLIGYPEAFSVQKQAVEDVIRGNSQMLFLCEHPAVLTMGRLGREDNILLSRRDLQQKNVDVLRIDRGGEVTLHSPGQIVLYPVLNLNFFGRDLKKYLVNLEQVAIDLLRDFDIVANRIEGQRGVWVGKEKIASIGIGVRKWVAYHGMAINVNTDLNNFEMIKPCGLDVRMTSIQKIRGTEILQETVKEKLVGHFCRIFQLEKI